MFRTSLKWESSEKITSPGSVCPGARLRRHVTWMHVCPTVVVPQTLFTCRARTFTETITPVQLEAEYNQNDNRIGRQNEVAYCGIMRNSKVQKTMLKLARDHGERWGRAGNLGTRWEIFFWTEAGVRIFTPPRKRKCIELAWCLASMKETLWWYNHS